MTIQQHASFDSSAAELNATSKLVKAWESKNAKNAAKAGGVSLMALSLAACGGSSTTTTTDTTTTDTSTTDTTTTVTVDAAQNFILATTIDVKAGGSGDDTFSADDTTLSVADNIDGGAGTDTFRIFDTGTNNIVLPADLNNVENLYIHALGNALSVAAETDVVSVELDALAAGVTLTVAATQSVTLDSTNAGGTTTIASAAGVTALTVNVDGIDAATDGSIGGINEDLEFSGTGLATLNLVTQNAASSFEIGNNGGALKTLNISGDQNVTIVLDDLADALVTTVNASTLTGNLDLVLDDDTAANTAVTGGSGDDEVDFGALLTQADSFDGGDGTDTLEMTQASLTTVNALSAANLATFEANMSNIEVIEISDALTSDLNADKFNTVNSVVLAAGISTTGTLTLSKVGSGATVEVNAPAAAADDILAVTMDNATLAGNNSDVLNVIFKDTVDGGAAAVSHYGVLNAPGVDILNITSTKGTDINGDASTASGTELDIAATSTALTTVNISGNLGVDIGDVTLISTVQTVDASGLVLSAVTGTGAEVVVAASGTTGVTMTGSNGVDTFTGGDGDDVITGNNGADVINGKGGSDTIDLTETISAADDVIIDQTSGMDTIKGFTAGVDDLSVLTATTTTAEVSIAAPIAEAALDDNDLIVISINSSTTSALATTGAATITDYTDTDNGGDVQTYLDEVFTIASADTATVVLNDGTNSYVYFILNDADTAFDGDAEITLIATVENAILAADSTSV